MDANDWLLGPSTYWFWSRIPSAEEIQRQVREIAAAGFQTFLIQARLSMPLSDYLSDEYLQAYRQAVIMAESLHLKVGLYDDYNWMSGHAGGRTVQARPESKEKHLFWTTGRIQGSSAQASISNIHSLMYEGFADAAMEWAYDGGIPVWDKWEVYKVLAFPSNEQPVTLDRIVDITPLTSLISSPDGSRFFINLSDTFLDGWTYVLFASAQCVSSRMINYLDPEAAQTFIQVGLEPYASVVGDFFGRTIRYTFFDHPYCGFYSWEERTGTIGNSLMFTAALPELFEAERGYGLETALLAFLVDLGDLTPSLRCDFFETYGRIGRESFFAPLKQWTAAHQLLLSGHELLGFVGTWGFTEGFASLDARTNFAGDYFDIDRYKDISAVDACNYSPQLSPVFGSSVARANGKQGCFIEQYAVSHEPGIPSAAGNWGLSLSTLRQQAVRFLLQGASHLIFHAFYLDDGTSTPAAPLANPRFDFPPGINFEPWFCYHAQFVFEYRTLCRLIQDAAHHSCRTPVAVLYPLHTYWVEGNTGEFSAVSGPLFQALSKSGIDFTILDERQLELVANNAPQMSFPCLILPSVTVVPSRSTLKVLSDYMDQGGHILVYGQEIHSTQIEGRLKDTDPRLKALRQHPNYHNLSQPVEQTIPLINQINDSFTLPRLITPGAWFHTICTHKGDWAFLFNDSETAGRFSFQYTGLKTVFSMNTNNGSLQQYLCRQNDLVWADLQAGEYRVFWIPREEQEKAFPALYDSSSAIIAASISPENSLMQITARIKNEIPTNFLIHAKSDLRKLDGKGIKQFTINHKNGQTNEVKLILQDWVKPFSIQGPWQIMVGNRTWNDLPDLTRSWEELGLENYQGDGCYRTQLFLTQNQVNLSWQLEYPAYTDPLELRINGRLVGGVSIDQRRTVIPVGYFYEGENTLEITTVNSADGYYYSGTPYASLATRRSGRIGALILHPLLDLTLTF